MKRILFLILGFFLFIFFSGVTFSATPSCPTPPQMIDLDKEFDILSVRVKDRAKNCILARSQNRESSIKDYVCPSGDFSEGDRPYTDEILSYQIAVATVFQTVDKVALEHARSLQCIRQKDPVIWQQSNKIFTDLTSGYAAKYMKACDMSYIVRLLNKSSTQWQYISDILQTSDVFPQYCDTLANAKIQALDNLVTLLSAKAIWKSYQNDKDQFVTEVKGKYASLLQKSSRYFRSISQAIAKIDAYTQKPIR